MKLMCGCDDEGQHRCDWHAWWPCHESDFVLNDSEREAFEGLCPPCRIAKWRSVSLSSAATPTRKLL